MRQSRQGIQPGQVIELGPHRIMCGDATNPEHVNRLFRRKRPDMVFTSPEYGNQRRYGGPQLSTVQWTILMQGMVDTLPENVQLLVNLGLIYRNKNWLNYWDRWHDYMLRSGWDKAGWYVWDKGQSVPGLFGSRLSPTFEFVFHFNKHERPPNRIVPCQTAGTVRNTGATKTDGLTRTEVHVVRDKKVMGAVVSVPSAASGKGSWVAHPARFPVGLPQAFIESYTDTGEIVYDPFIGSGTTLEAAEATGRRCIGMELNPEYCQMVVDRYRHLTEG